MTISPAAAAILRQAASHPHLLADPKVKLPPAAKKSVAKKLIQAGLLEEIALESADMAWLTTPEFGPTGLRVTEAGADAIGVQIEADATPDRGPEPTTPAAEDATAAEPDAAPKPTKISLRDAAQAVLDAWSKEDGIPSTQPALLEAIQNLAAAMAGRPARIDGEPRVGTKQATVLEMLRREGGASGPEIMAATGWQSHTVRGFLAIQKRKGVTIEVVRQHRGDDGTYSVYRAV